MGLVPAVGGVRAVVWGDLKLTTKEQQREEVEELYQTKK